MAQTIGFKLLSIVRKLNEIAIIALFTVIICTVFLQVVARYVFNSPPAWSEELARYCQVWMVLLTSSICIRKGSHLAVDYLTHHLNERMKRWLGISSHMLIILYLGAVLYYGFVLVKVGQFQYSPAMEIRMAFMYLVFPIAYSMMLIEAVLVTVGLMKEPA
ncbi:MAG: TRAP transporter small permease [Desulfobacterales bacterium]|nr:TRAP transporter small permease [Deltaproteobacteria bacterium]NNK94899.1 TRAP transporter small permease [Desulfobacterales bacterium]